MYRAALYEADLCRLGKRLAEQHNQKALRHHQIEVRVYWNRLRASLQSRDAAVGSYVRGGLARSGIAGRPKGSWTPMLFRCEN